MYKKVEILSKDKHSKLKFDEISSQEVAKNTGLIPLGFSEVIEMAPFCPVIINGDEKHLEFVAFSGISSSVNIYSKDLPYIPMYARTYPFVNVVLMDKAGNKQDVIGIDKNDDIVGLKKKNFIFKKDVLEEIAKQKIDMVRELNRQREISRKIIKELQQHDLLQKKDFKVNFEEQSRVVLDNFYVVDRIKLMKLDGEVLALWAKKGWITLIDMHLKSINNFPKVIL